MKQRVLTGIVGGLLALVALLLHNTIVFNFVVMIITVFSMYEALGSTGYVRNRAVFIASVVFSAIVAFFPLFDFIYGILLSVCYAAALFVIALAKHETIALKELSFSFMMTAIIPFSLMTLCVFARIGELRPDTYFESDGLFLLLVSFGGAWFCDIGAYFAGSFFGTHKMAPNISPKKTIEGAAGGIVANIVMLLIIGLIWKTFALSAADSIQWLPLILLAVITAAVGMFGDLMFSLIKRKCKIKDYGSIIPGHGGMLDRFDSLITAAPVVYIFIQFFPLVIRA